MSEVGSGDDLREAAHLARECTVMGDAVTLARWAGTGRPVTAGQVLRRADIPAAGAALRVPVPSRVRTAADVPALHRPWCVARATGALLVSGGRAAPGPALEDWPPADDELLAGWLAGLQAVCRAESYPQEEDSVRLLVLALLAVLADGDTSGRDLWDVVDTALRGLCDVYDKPYWESRDAARRYCDPDTGKPLTGLVALLAAFGAVTAVRGRPRITPLGRWAVQGLRAGLPGLADPRLTAGELIAELCRFGDEEQRQHVAWGWLADRDPAEAAREILAAADGLAPSQRSVAVGVVEGLGEDALPTWQEMAAAPCVGPHARAVLAAWDQGPEPGEEDWRWLAVEEAAVALADRGPDEALTLVYESMPGEDLDARLAAVRATGHPGGGALARAVVDFAASGAPRTIDQAMQLKVSLAGFRPPIWRQVQVHATATLGDLHEVIQVLYGWDGDHLHAFSVGKKQYSDPFFDLGEMEDEDDVRVHDALQPGGKITYLYDFGASWRHEITFEKVLAREPGRDYPVCTGFHGDSPPEYWTEDDEPAEPEPFRLPEVNRKLAALARHAGA